MEMLINKIPDISGLVTTTVLDTKFKVVDNKISDFSGLARKTDYRTKILEIETKYFTNCDSKKFTSDILHTKIKQKKIVNKCYISNLVKNSDLNTKLATLAKKGELKAGLDKIVKLQEFYSSYFHVKNFFGDDGFQNIFVYQPTLNRLELLVGNQKVYLKLLPLHVSFLPNIKNFGIKIGIQFNSTPLVLKHKITQPKL